MDFDKLHRRVVQPKQQRHKRNNAIHLHRCKRAECSDRDKEVCWRNARKSSGLRKVGRDKRFKDRKEAEVVKEEKKAAKKTTKKTEKTEKAETKTTKKTTKKAEAKPEEVKAEEVKTEEVETKEEKTEE